MEEMKFVENPTVNAMVSEIIEALKEEIVSNLHPKSIILSGSFGKGEVTVIEEKNDGLKFLSDCDVIIIPNRYIFNRDKVKQFCERFFERTGLKVDLSGVILSVYLLFPFLNRKLKPTMGNYDLKYGSKVIYGKNYLGRIPDFKQGDIPLWEGIKLMFNRMAEALQYFSTDYLDKYPSEEEERKLLFWINKIILACQDALLISAKKYHYSYTIRNEMFQEIFSKHFGALDKQILNFLPLTVKATEYKLNPKERYYKDVVEFWFEVTEIADKVFRYIMEKEKGITFDSYVEFQETFLKYPKIRPSIYQNLISAIKMWINSHKISSPKIITEIRVPWTYVVYSLILLIYFNLSRDSYINESYLKKAREILSAFKELKEPSHNISEEFDYLRKEALNLWYAICH